MIDSDLYEHSHHIEHAHIGSAIVYHADCFTWMRTVSA